MPTDRYRCATCGNLTRFDVTVTRRTRAFHHYSLGGELTIEDEEVLSETVEEVACRWCGSGQGHRDPGPACAGVGDLTPALDSLLRPALEAAVEGRPDRGGGHAGRRPAPVALRPFLNFAKLPSRAVAAARRAVDDDDDFRARVAEDASQDEVGRAGWLWLTRPEGWQEELDAMASGVAEAGEAAAERRAENEARRRLEGAEAATRRAEAAAASAQAESARATTALAEERRARRAAARRRPRTWLGAWSRSPPSATRPATSATGPGRRGAGPAGGWPT